MPRVDQNDHRREHKHQRRHGQLLRDPEGRHPALQVLRKLDNRCDASRLRSRLLSEGQCGNTFLRTFFYLCLPLGW